MAWPQGKVNDLRLLDGQREEGDFLQRFDIHIIDQACQVREVDPLLSLAFPLGALGSRDRVALEVITKASAETFRTSHSSSPTPHPLGLRALQQH